MAVKPEIDAVMERGMRLYHRRPGWEDAECYLTDQLKRFDAPEAFAAAVWFSLILSEWNPKRFLSAGAYEALVVYGQHADAWGFYPSIIGAMRLLRKSRGIGVL